MSIKDNALAHFGNKAGKMKEIFVPEWDGSIFYLPVLTVPELSAVAKLQGKDGSMTLEALAEVMVLRARNEDGSLIWTKGDLFDINSRYDGEVVARVAGELLETTIAETESKAKN